MSLKDPTCAKPEGSTLSRHNKTGVSCVKERERLLDDALFGRVVSGKPLANHLIYYTYYIYGG